VFRGGTCLSKVHAAFFRLSEDLDFVIPMQVDASVRARREAASPVKQHIISLPERHKCFQGARRFEGHNGSRQYDGDSSYRSVITGKDEKIKVDISLREPILLPPEDHLARVLLLDPHSNEPAFPLVKVRVLSLHEAYAEKVRAALTRREPAIRDFFDIDSAIQRRTLNHLDGEVLRLVGEKLSVLGNDPIDISERKVTLLRGQIEPQLGPVLRETDYDRFNLERVVEILAEMARPRGRKWETKGMRSYLDHPEFPT
jgi:predicted nucleotidyltransferase component of viral defense system